MKRLTKDNPKGCFERLMNYAYTKHNRVHLSYADGKDDIDLCEYISKLAKAKGFDFSPEFIMEDGLFDNYDDDFAVLYYLAVQAAELRSRLKLYEDKLENGTLIELPKGVNFIHSERLIKPLRPGDEYEWQSIYRLTLYVAGKSTSLETARHQMNNADEEFLKRTNIPYKEEGEI